MTTTVSNEGIGESMLQKRVQSAATTITWLGVILTFVGVAALVFPMITTLVGTVFVGWLLLLSGLVSVFGAFSIRGTGPFFGSLLFGLLSVAAGVLMLAQPVGGALAITLALGFLFMVQGASEVFFAIELRPGRYWGWMLLSGIASIVLSIVIVSGLPGTSLITLGLLIGVNFITSGVGYVMLGVAVRRIAPKADDRA